MACESCDKNIAMWSVCVDKNCNTPFGVCDDCFNENKVCWTAFVVKNGFGTGQNENRHTDKMKIFIIYDSTGFVWERAYKSFDRAILMVKEAVDEQNFWAKCDGAYEDEEDRPANMEKEFTYKDEQGGVMVAHNELEKISTFVKELIL